MDKKTLAGIDPNRLVIQGGVYQGCVLERSLSQIGAGAVNDAIDCKRKDPNSDIIPEREGEIAMEKEVTRRAAEASKALCAEDRAFTAAGAGFDFTLNRMTNERKGIEQQERPATHK